jgi:hypothetical protein
MAQPDQLLFGVYVGLVLDTQDPDNLGRVKLIVPGKTGPLFDGWNNQVDDISFTSVESKPFSSDILERLLGVLPWARPSMPLWGGATGSPVNTSSYNPIPMPTDSSLTGTSGKLGRNGFLDKENKTQLIPVRGESNAYLNPTVENKYQELLAAAKKDGVNLGITDSYRSYGEQVTTKQNKGSLAATPGHSKHGYGLAIDFKGGNGTSNQKAYEWLKNNASNYGWSNFVSMKGPDTQGPGGTQKEPWHWQINEADLPKYENKADALANANATPGASTDNPSGKTDNRSVPQYDGFNNKEGKKGGGVKDVGSSGCSGSSGNPLTKEQALGISDGLNKQTDASVADGSLPKIIVKNGVMDEASFKAYAVARLKNSPLLCASIDPAQASRYKMSTTKTPEAWADFAWKTALAENGGKVVKTDRDMYTDPGGSFGAFSSSPSKAYDKSIGKWVDGDAKKYAGYDGVTDQTLQSSPEIATNVILSTIESEVTRKNSIDTLDNSVDKVNGSFASTTMAALRGERGTLSASKGGSLIQRLTAMGQSIMGSLNIGRAGGPIGTFSIPAAGSKVWVAFEGGSPQRPVYLGQVYEPSNIQALE